MKVRVLFAIPLVAACGGAPHGEAASRYAAADSPSAQPSSAPAVPAMARAIPFSGAEVFDANLNPPQSRANTFDLGSAADVFCAVQSVTGRMHGYCTATKDFASVPSFPCETPSPGVSQTDLVHATGFVLYVDADGHWQLFVEGAPFAVAGACIPWSAIGLAHPPVDRVDAAFVANSPPAPTATHGACVLSSATDSYENGAGAQIADTGLSVHGGNGTEWLWASATCVDGLAYVDVAANKPIPSNTFCGLSRLEDMSGSDSSVSVTGSVVAASHATGAARCFATQ